MDVNDILETGSGILQDVTKAVEKGDFEGLSSSIQNRVNDAVDKVKLSETEGWRGTGSGRKTSESKTYQNAYSSAKRTASQRARAAGQTTSQNEKGELRTQNYFMQKNISKSKGLVRVIAGGISTVVSGLFFLVFLFSAFLGFEISEPAVGAILLVVAGAMGVGTWLSVRMLTKGIKTQKLVDKYYRYGQRLMGKEFFAIEDLAGKVGLPENQVRGDLIEMMHQDFLPKAVMDEGQTTVMLTDHAAQMYEEAKKSYGERVMLEAASASAKKTKNAKKDTKKDTEPSENANLDPAVREILKKGNAYSEKIRWANDEIPDTEEMSNKLYRLEDVVRRIFKQVEKNPSSAGDLRRVMDYYLPTTQKLLDSYVEFYHSKAKGVNAEKTKREIEEAIDTVSSAFEQLLDQMFQDTAWDISSDINVMKTMFAQDGLSDRNNKINGNGGE